MSFTSLGFLFFLVGVFLFYFLTPKKYRYIALLVSSYVFYYFASKKVMIYLPITTVTVYLAGRILQKLNTGAKNAPDQPEQSQAEKAALRKKLAAKKKLILIATLLLNFGILAVLKYGVLIAATVKAILPAETAQLITFRKMILPLGISFYTFQSLGYLIDVYRGKYQAEKNIFKFALFTSFFPQIVQGPIARFDELAKQLVEPHSFDFERAKNGIVLIGWGFVKKLIVADRLAVIVSKVYDQPDGYGGSILLFAAFVYSLQVYCDFTAGMDIASGVAEVMGIHITKNFRQPYYANSIADFWRRWHITLGAWMRDYLFYPLSLSKPFGRLGKAVRNRWGMRWSKIVVSGIISFIVFTVVGIWHGAETKYILYGFWNGTLIMLAILLEPLFAKGLSALHIKQEDKGWKAFRIARTLLLLSIGRSIVCSQSASTAIAAIYKMVFAFAPGDLINGTLGTLGLDAVDYGIVGVMLLIVFWIDHLHEKGKPVRAAIASKPIVFRWAVYFFIIISLMILIPFGVEEARGFIYAQF